MSVQTPASRWGHAAHALARPVDAASLAVFRVAFGGVMAWELARAFSLGRIERQFVQPALLFPYFGFGWLPRLDAQAMFALYTLLIGAAVCVALGLAYRLAAIFLCVGYSYTFLVDQAQYQNHLYLFCLLALIVACIDAHRTWSFDARKARGSACVPAWQPALVAFQVGVVYAFGGINKLSASWLSGVPMALELDRTFAALGVQSWAYEPAVAQSFAVAGALIDLGAVPGLLWRRTRTATFALLCVFHLSNAKLFSIGVFPWFMIGASTLFFPPDWPRRLVRGQARLPAGPAPQALRGGRLLALATYCLLQLLIPLRHHLYGTDTDWTADASYFRWSMKLHTRVGLARCFVRFADGREREVDLARLLSPRQRQHLAYTPDMIHRFTAFMQRRYPRQLGHELRWESVLSLDGRAPQPYVVAGAAEILRLPISLAPSHFVRPMQDPRLPSLAELEQRACGGTDGASFPRERAAR